MSDPSTQLGAELNQRAISPTSQELGPNGHLPSLTLTLDYQVISHPLNPFPPNTTPKTIASELARPRPWGSPIQLVRRTRLFTLPPTQPTSKKPKSKAYEPATPVDLNDICVKDLEMDENRRKINRLLDSGTMTKTAFAEIGVSLKSLNDFLGSKKAAAAVFDVSDIVLDGEDNDAAPIYDTCDEARKKINAHLKKPGAKQARLCRDIDAQLKGPSTNQAGKPKSKHGQNMEGSGNRKKAVPEPLMADSGHSLSEDGTRGKGVEVESRFQAPLCPKLESAVPPVRKLVSVRQISNVQRVSGTDWVAIHLDGWRVLVSRRSSKF
ncbi:hypothetical protein VTI74DRAFT_10480 [Chaetomium olivicolor]